MPGGRFDSSKTRVAPVLDELVRSGKDWVLPFLKLAEHPRSFQQPTFYGDLSFVSGRWGKNEIGLRPPVALLSWMLRNPNSLIQQNIQDQDRCDLINGIPSAVERALDLLRSNATDKAWYIFEGPTYPDAYIETNHALIVIEGKRTESGPTTSTTWLEGRHQIWRHIDAAWERRGCRKVYGMFVVEATSESFEVPANWRTAADDALSKKALDTSFPHRSDVERNEIAHCFLGVTTWQKVVARFNLPDTILVPTL
jgi:hypothetical protein